MRLPGSCPAIKQPGAGSPAAQPAGLPVRLPDFLPAHTLRFASCCRKARLVRRLLESTRRLRVLGSWGGRRVRALSEASSTRGLGTSATSEGSSCTGGTGGRGG